MLNSNDAPVCPAFKLDGLCDWTSSHFCHHVTSLIKLLPSSHTSSRLVDLLTLHKYIEPTKDFYFYVQRNCYNITSHCQLYLQVAP